MGDNGVSPNEMFQNWKSIKKYRLVMTSKQILHSARKIIKIPNV